MFGMAIDRTDNILYLKIKLFGIYLKSCMISSVFKGS